MKSYKMLSAAILVALSLYPPWAGAQAETNTNAQTDTDTQTSSDTQSNTDTQANSDTQTSTNAQTNTNLYRARINLVCTTADANGNLVHDRITTLQFVEECALAMGVTNFSDLALAYNRSNDSLEVVNRSTHEVICAPLSFGVGTALTNANGTRVLVHNFVFLNSEAIASGLLSATQRLAYANSGELRSFGMRGSIFYSFTDGTNSPTICRGAIAVGTSISTGRDRNKDLDDDNDDDDNNGNQGQGNNGNQGNGNNGNNGNRNNGNNNNGNNGNNNNNNNNNVSPGFGTTNGNQGAFGTTNVNSGGFGITNNPVIFTNNANQGFTANQGFGTGFTGVGALPNTGFGAGFNINQGSGAGFSQGAGTGVNQ